MDDVGEIQSPVSSSPSDGRISVAVDDAAADAAAVLTIPPPSSPKEPAPDASNALARTNNTGGGGGGGGGREDCWSEGATAVLIEAWGERHVELSRGNLKHNHWKEVADIVASREGWAKPPKTDIQCKNRIDTVKKKYKSERAKIDAGNGPSKWRFYNRLEQFIGSNPKSIIVPATKTKTPLSLSAPPGRSIRIAVPGSGTAIPVRSRSEQQYQFGKPQMKGGSGNRKTNGSQKLKIQYGKRGTAAMRDFSSEDEEEEEEEEEVAFPDSDDSLPPEKKKRRVAPVGMQQQRQKGGGKEKKGTWGSSIRMFTASILKLGEAYEQAENAKLQQVVEMEKTRMKFAKELELQRMQFFMKPQMDISELKHRRGSAGGGGGGGEEGGIGFVAAAAAAIAATSNHHDGDQHQSHDDDYAIAATSNHHDGDHHQSHDDDYDHHSDGGKPVRADTINSDSDN